MKKLTFIEEREEYLSSRPAVFPKCSWLADVEIREQGAQGIFTKREFYVRANDEETAKRYILEDAAMYSLETRFIKNLRRVA